MRSSYIAQGEASPTFRRCLPILTDEIQDNPSQPSPEAVFSVTLDPIKLKINLNHHRWSRRILSMSLRETGEWGIQKPVLYSYCLGAPQPGIQEVLWTPEQTSPTPAVSLIISIEDSVSGTRLLVQSQTQLLFPHWRNG